MAAILSTAHIAALNPDVPRASLVHVQTDYYDVCHSLTLQYKGHVAFVTTHDPAAHMEINGFQVDVGAATTMVPYMLMSHVDVLIFQTSSAPQPLQVAHYCLPVDTSCDIYRDGRFCQQFTPDTLAVYERGMVAFVCENQYATSWCTSIHGFLAPEHLDTLRRIGLALSDDEARAISYNHDFCASRLRHACVLALLPRNQ